MYYILLQFYIFTIIFNNNLFHKTRQWNQLDRCIHVCLSSLCNFLRFCRGLNHTHWSLHKNETKDSIVTNNSDVKLTKIDLVLVPYYIYFCLDVISAFFVSERKFSTNDLFHITLQCTLLHSHIQRHQPSRCNLHYSDKSHLHIRWYLY